MSATSPATLPVASTPWNGCRGQWRRAGSVAAEPGPATGSTATLGQLPSGHLCWCVLCAQEPVRGLFHLLSLQQVLQTAALTQTVLTVETVMA